MLAGGSSREFEPVSAETQPVSERPARKFRILKNPRAETRLGFRGLWRESPKIRRQRPEARPLTSGNVASSQSSVTLPEETAVAGWGARIRTWEWRNQNPTNFRSPSTFILKILVITHPSAAL
jgi:hypothetical protein